MSKRIILSLFFGIFFSLIITFLFFKQFLYPTILPVVHDGNLRIFADWTVIVSANNCFEKGYDVFLENPCDPLKRIHVYGSVFLLLPTISKFQIFFYLVLPIFLISIFIFLIITHTIIGGFALYRMKVRETVENPDSTFTPVPATITPAGLELDPDTPATLDENQVNDNLKL